MVIASVNKLIVQNLETEKNTDTAFVYENLNFSNSCFQMDENKTHNQQNSNENKIKNTESKIHDQLPPLSDEQAEQSLDVLYEISRLMNCGIPRDKLGTCIAKLDKKRRHFCL